MINDNHIELDRSTEQSSRKMKRKELPRTPLNDNESNKSIKAIPIPRDDSKGFPLLYIKEEYYNLDDLVAENEIKQNLENIAIENRLSKRLLSYGLNPKRKILFCGPPGTGKTLSAKILSSMINYPFVYVLFDSIMSSFLGETANNLRKIFDFIELNKYVVLFDEFDIIGKKRDDPHEHGEIKRVVNNFMQMMDNYRGESIIVAATNHQHILDVAIWRRFDEVIYYPLPDLNKRKKLFDKYLRVLKRSIDYSLVELARETDGLSSADIAQICQDAMRRTIINGKPLVNKNMILWSIKEQKRRKEIMSKGF